MEHVGRSGARERSHGKHRMDHRRNAAILERALAKAVAETEASSCKKLDVVAVLFGEIVKVDPYYGRLLGEIKSAYDEAIDSLAMRDIDYNERRVEELRKELTGAKREVEALRRQSMAMVTELKSKSLCAEAQKNRIRELSALLRKQQQLTQDSSSPRNEARRRHTRQGSSALESSVQNVPNDSGKARRSVVVPRLDLSKVHAAPSVQADGKNPARAPIDAKKSESLMYAKSNTEVLGEHSENVPPCPKRPEPSKMKEQYDRYVDLCNKSKSHCRDILGRLKQSDLH